MNSRVVAPGPLAIGVLALLVGCAVGPDYERPDVKVGRDMPEIAPVVTASDVRFTENEPWARWSPGTSGRAGHRISRCSRGCSG